MPPLPSGVPARSARSRCPILIVLAICVAVHVLLAYTQFGRNLYAVGGNLEAAFLAGIDVVRNKILAFVLSGLLAAVSGVLLASRLNSSTVHIGLDSGLWAIAAAIIGGASLTGGKGSVLGAVLGVVTLGVLVNGMNLLGRAHLLPDRNSRHHPDRGRRR